MDRLKQLGVRIAIDDFGTGYSSLSYLHRLPIDVIKIDRLFLEKITEPQGTYPIVTAILSLAKALKVETVAEGIETEVQLALLTELGSERFQGYLFSRPLARHRDPCVPAADALQSIRHDLISSAERVRTHRALLLRCLRRSEWRALCVFVAIERSCR